MRKEGKKGEINKMGIKTKSYSYGEKIYFHPISTVVTRRKNKFKKKGGGEEYENYIPTAFVRLKMQLCLPCRGPPRAWTSSSH